MFKNQYLAVTRATQKNFENFRTTPFHDFKIYGENHLNISRAQHLSVEILLLGFAINPLQPQQSNDDIVELLAQKCDSLEKFWDAILDLSGRYVLLYKNQTDFVVVGDACHLRQIYYHFAADGAIAVTSSPKMFLSYYDYEPQIAQNKKDFMETPGFQREAGAWIGDKCVDNRLQKVLPNHYLDIVAREVKRVPFACFCPQKEDLLIEKSARILHGTFAALHQRYQVIQALTSGWDSRILLAASKSWKYQTKYYVFHNENMNIPDVQVPQKLAAKLGFDFQPKQSESLRTDFVDVFKQGFIATRLVSSTSHIQHHYDHHSDENIIAVNGNVTEILRCFYGYTHTSIPLDMLLIFSGYNDESVFVKEELTQWYSKAKDYAKQRKLFLLDLFYWEQRLGNWGALYPFEQDIAIEQISPFNNRRLLLSILQIPARCRAKPNYLFFRKLIQYMWPETLSEPFNPDTRLINQWIKRSSWAKYLFHKARLLGGNILR